MPGALALQMRQQQSCPNCEKEHVYTDVQDSLAAHLTCPHCNEPWELHGIRIPPAPFTRSTASYAQKLFPVLGKFGIGIFGTPVIGTKTVFNHIKGLERTLRREENEHGIPLSQRLEEISVSWMATRVFDFLRERFEEAYPDTAKIPEDQIVGMQIVGFDAVDAPMGKSYIATLGVAPNLKCEEQLDTPTYSGDPRVVDGLLQVLAHFDMLPTPAAFSLQDAVDYAEFLITTTALAQRFAPMIPTVGGEVDVALITSYAGFQWIKAKQLTRQLEGPLHAREG